MMFYYNLIVLLSFGYEINGFVSENFVCPYGYTKIRLDQNYCMKYGRKGMFTERYDSCNNIPLPIVNPNALIKHLKKIDNDPLDYVQTLWLDVRRIHNDGPYIKWDSGLPYNRSDKIVKFLKYPWRECVAFDIRSEQLEPRNCTEKFHRLCIIKPFPDIYNPGKGLCKDQFSYFSSVEPACLSKVYRNDDEGFRNGTRDDIEKFCLNLESKGGLIKRGVIYKEHLLKPFKNITIPLDYTKCDNTTINCAKLPVS